MLYNVVLVSAIYQHESTICIHMPCTSWTSLPLPTFPPKVVTEYGLELPASYSKFPLAIYFTHGNVRFHAILSILPTLSFPDCVHESVLCVCVSTAALQIGSLVPSLQISYTCADIQYLFFTFWFTSLCIIGWRRKWQPTPVFLSGKSHGQTSLVGYSQSVGSQRVRHDWHWLKCIPLCDWVICHCVYVPQLLCLFICWWISRLLPFPGYCK